MPEIVYYEVEQTRVVRVAANDERSALDIANVAFGHNSATEIVDRRGHSIGRVKVKSVYISREH